MASDSLVGFMLLFYDRITHAIPRHVDRTNPLGLGVKKQMSE